MSSIVTWHMRRGLNRFLIYSIHMVAKMLKLKLNHLMTSQSAPSSLGLATLPDLEQYFRNKIAYMLDPSVSLGPADRGQNNIWPKRRGHSRSKGINTVQRKD